MLLLLLFAAAISVIAVAMSKPEKFYGQLNLRMRQCITPR
jgi:hypothetical protein